MFKISNKTYFSIYFLLTIILLYQSKGVLYEEGFISTGLALIELVFCAFYMLKVILLEKKANIALSLIVLSIITTCSFILSPKDINGFRPFYMYRHIIGAIMPFFPLYYFSRKGLVSERTLHYFFYVLFVITICLFFKSYFIGLKNNQLGQTLNSSYRFVSLLPYLTLIKRKWISPFVIISIICLLLGVKRGAILAYSLGLFIIGIDYLRTSKYFILSITILAIIAIVVAYIGLMMYEDSLYLQSRLEDTISGGSSGRDRIYTSLLETWMNSNSLITFLFGLGFCQTVSIAGNVAHNDWLEFLIDMGMIGFITYLLVYVFLVRFLVKNKTVDKLPLLLIIFLLFLTSLYSMAFWDEPSCCYFIFLGYLLGNSEYVKNNVN